MTVDQGDCDAPMSCEIMAVKTDQGRAFSHLLKVLHDSECSTCMAKGSILSRGAMINQNDSRTLMKPWKAPVFLRISVYQGHATSSFDKKEDN